MFVGVHDEVIKPLIVDVYVEERFREEQSDEEIKVVTVTIPDGIGTDEDVPF